MPDFFARHIACPECGARYFQDQPWKRVCLPCYLKAKKAETFTRPPPPPPSALPQIEPTMLRRLLQLCHPDRHGNSPASNEATRYLLALREGRAP